MVSPANAARRRRGAAAPADPPASSSTSHADAADHAHAVVPNAFVPTALTSSHTPLAVAARNGSPAVLLGALALCFKGLVGVTRKTDTGVVVEESADNDRTALITLSGLLVVAIIVQAASSIVGLPPAGSLAPVAPGEKKRKRRKPNYIVTTVMSLILTALATPFVHLVLVLFGAPFLAQTLRTLLCAAHFAVLGLYPVIYTRGTDGTGAWSALVSGADMAQQLDAAVGGLYGASVGAWLGAVPIPLDWDRAWQRWPLTVLVGIYLGHAVGRLLGGALQRR